VADSFAHRYRLIALDRSANQEAADEMQLLCPEFFDHSAQVSAGTIKVATVNRYHCDSHDQMHTHLAGFIAA